MFTFIVLSHIKLILFKIIIIIYIPYLPLVLPSEHHTGSPGFVVVHVSDVSSGGSMQLDIKLTTMGHRKSALAL